MNMFIEKGQLENMFLFGDYEITKKNFVFIKYKKNQMVKDSVDGNASIGVILSGRVEVYSVAIDGSEIKLSELKEGDYFGICNLFSDFERETILRCKNKVEVSYISKDILLNEMEKNPELAVKYAKICSDKIRFLLRRIESLTIQSCKGKLIEYLLSNCSNKGIIKLKDTKESLAKSLGVSRAALFRELLLLQKENLIAVSGVTIKILDYKTLEEKLYFQ